MVSREDFKKVWKDSSREAILNQFYYEHYELVRIKKEISEYIDKNKASLPMGRDEFTCAMRYSDPVVLAHKVLEILDKGDEK